MKLSSFAYYAIGALAHLAKAEDGKILTSDKLAEELGFPRKFLLKAMTKLATARFVSAVKGPRGGYGLAKPADKITLLAIIEAIDEPIRGLTPLADIPGRKIEKCDKVTAATVKAATDAQRDYLDAITLADLVKV